MKKRVPYIGLFFLFLFWNLILVSLHLDEIWNYGFAHNIYKGLIPYKDFNMIITPLYPFLMSLSFHLFGSSMLVFHIEQAFILTVLCWLLFYLLKNKAWFVIVFFFFPFSFSAPNYNLLLFFWFVLLIFMEKRETNDYMIGFVLGLAVLTKQSVGFCLALVSLYYIKDWKRIVKRLIGLFIPVVIFLIYLFITDSFKAFLNLCVFGLFDFAFSNSHGINICFFLLLMMVGVVIYFICRDKKNIYYYYVLAFFSIMVPLFDAYHLQIAFLSFLMILLFRKIKIPIRPTLFAAGVIGGVFVVTAFYRFQQKIIYPNDINHFEYRFLDYNNIQLTKEVNRFLKQHSGMDIIFLNSNAYYFRLISDTDITYLDLINEGNWGYHGSEKLLKEIKNKKSSIFIIDKEDLSSAKQADKKAIQYVIQNGKKIKSIRIFDIYILNTK